MKSQLFLAKDIAVVDESKYKFRLRTSPQDSDVRFDVGPYQMGKEVNKAYIYRSGHPLAQYVIAKAKKNETPDESTIVFDHTNHPEKISVVEEAIGKSGILTLNLIHYKSPKEDEDRIIAVAVDADGNAMPGDFVDKLMSVTATANAAAPIEASLMEKLQTIVASKRKELDIDIRERDRQFIDEESTKIEQWAEDQTNSLEQDLRDTKQKIKERNNDFRKETDDTKRRQIQAELLTLERTLKQKRRDIFALEDEIEAKRDILIKQIDESLNKESQQETLFTLTWKVV